MFRKNPVQKSVTLILLIFFSVSAGVKYSLDSLTSHSAVVAFQINSGATDKDYYFAFTSQPETEVFFSARVFDSLSGAFFPATVKKRDAGFFAGNWLQWYSFKIDPSLSGRGVHGSINIRFSSAIYKSVTADNASIKGNVLLVKLPGGLQKTAIDLPSVPFTHGVRLSILEDGIYQITQAQLKEAGVPVDRIDSRTFRLFEKDREIPIHITNSRETRLGSDDKILFYGKALRGTSHYFEQFSNTNCYWLTWGAAPGSRVAEVSGQRRKDPTKYSSSGWVQARNFEDTIHLEYDNFILNLGNVADRPPDEVTDPPTSQSLIDDWYWGQIGKEELTRFEIQIPSAASSGNARMRIGLMGITKNDSVKNDHSLRILFNNDPVGKNDSAVWDGQNFFTYTSDTFPVTRFDSLNTVSFITSKRNFHDYSALNWIELIYSRDFKSVNNHISFKNNPNALGKVVEYELQNFSESDLELWDTGRGRYFVDFLKSSGTGNLRKTTSLIFQDSINYETRYLAQSISKRLTPAQMVLDTIKNRWQELAGTEYIIISDSRFRDEFEPLMRTHEEMGLSTAFVEIDDIYNKFSWGIRNPESIRIFLKFLFSISGKNPPRFLLLGGDTTHDLDKKSSQNIVPTHLSRFPGWGPGADDGYFGTVWGEDNFPDICIGRFPAGNEQEVRTLVDKTVNYIKNPQRGYWRDNLLLLGGGEPDFTLFNDEAVDEAIGPGMNIIRMDADSGSQFYRDGFTASSFISNNINSGTFLINFNGHGGGNIWSDNNFFGYNDLPKLYNGQWGTGGRLPIVFSFTCLTGFFESNFYRSLGEEFIRTNHNGAICFYGASAYTSKNGNLIMNKLLLELALSGDFSTVGELMDFCELNMLVRYGPEFIFLIRQYNLLGDPALPWKLTPDTLNLKLTNTFLEKGDSLKITGSTKPVKKGNVKLSIKAGYQTWNQSIDSVKNSSFSKAVAVKPNASTSSGIVRAYAWNDTSEVRGWVHFAKDSIMVNDVHLSPERPFFGDSVRISCRLQSREAPVVQCIYAIARANREDVSWSELFMDRDSADLYISREKIPLKISGDVTEKLLLYFRVVTAGESKQSSLFSFPINGRPDLAFTGNSLKLDWADDSLRIRFTVLNIGNAVSPPFRVLLKWIQPNGNSDTIAVIRCRDSLFQGVFRSFSYAIPDTQGSLVFSGIINSDNKVSEILYGNNSATARSHLTYANLRDQTDTLSSASGGLQIVPVQKLKERRRVFLFDNPLSSEQPLLTSSQWVNLKSDSAAEMSIGSRPALSKSDTLLWIFRPDTTGLNSLLKKTAASSGKLAVMKYDTVLSRWRFAGGSPEAGNSRYRIKTVESGPHVLSFLNDTRAPDIELSVFGRTLSFLDYAAKGKPFNIMLSDPSEIYPGSVSMVLNKKALSSDKHSAVPVSGDLKNIQITAYPEPQRSVDSLIISLEDLAGNRTSRAYAYMPGEELSIKFLACHPNPFTAHKKPDGTIRKIRFAFLLTDVVDKIDLAIYTVSGRKIRTWTMNGLIGYQEIEWDGRDMDGYRIANGTYYAKLTASNAKRKVKKIIRIAKLEGY